jgi:hypothetical protein
MNSASGVRFASRLRVGGNEPVEIVEEIRHLHRGPPKQPQCVSLAMLSVCLYVIIRIWF